MKWEVVEYEAGRKEGPVSEFIKKQQPQAIAKIAHLINLLEIHGSFLGMPHAKKFENYLYELRIRGKEEIRIIYGFKGKTIYLLHGFKNKTENAPKEIATAKQRYLSLT